MTIHKAQGQTLGRVAVLLTEPAFTYGQLYVAASRVGIADQLHFALPAGRGGNLANWPTWSTAPPCTATANNRRSTHRTGPKCFLLAGFGELRTTRGVSSLQKEIHPQSSVAASIYYTSVKLVNYLVFLANLTPTTRYGAVRCSLTGRRSPRRLKTQNRLHKILTSRTQYFTLFV